MQLQGLKAEEILMKLSDNFKKIEFFLSDIDETVLFKTRKNGGWTVKQIIGHLYDTQEVWGERIKQCCMNPGTLLESYDPESYVEKRDYNNADLNRLLKDYKQLRNQMYSLLIEGNWEKEAYHPEEGTRTVKDLAETIMQHEIHHLKQLEEIKSKDR